MKWQYESENDDRDRVRDKLTLRYAEWLSKGKTSPHNNQDYTTRLQQRGGFSDAQTWTAEQSVGRAGPHYKKIFSVSFISR